MKKLSKILALILSSSILISNIGVVKAVKPENSHTDHSKKEKISSSILDNVVKFKDQIPFGGMWIDTTLGDTCITKEEFESVNAEKMTKLASEFELQNFEGCELLPESNIRLANTFEQYQTIMSALSVLEKKRIDKEDLIDFLCIAHRNKVEIPDKLNFNSAQMSCCSRISVFYLMQDEKCVFTFWILTAKTIPTAPETLPPLEPLKGKDSFPTVLKTLPPFEPSKVKDTLPTALRTLPPLEPLKGKDSFPTALRTLPPFEPLKGKDALPTTLRTLPPTKPSKVKDTLPTVLETLPPLKPLKVKDTLPTVLETLPPLKPLKVKDTLPTVLETLPPLKPLKGKDSLPTVLRTLPPTKSSKGKDSLPTTLRILPPLKPLKGKDSLPTVLRTLPPPKPQEIQDYENLIVGLSNFRNEVLASEISIESGIGNTCITKKEIDLLNCLTVSGVQSMLKLKLNKSDSTDSVCAHDKNLIYNFEFCYILLLSMTIYQKNKMDRTDLIEFLCIAQRMGTKIPDVIKFNYVRMYGNDKNIVFYLKQNKKTVFTFCIPIPIY